MPDLSQLLSRFLCSLLLLTALAIVSPRSFAQTTIITPKKNVVLKLDPVTGLRTVNLGDVAVVNAPADATVTISPKQFECAGAGPQTVTVTIVNPSQVKFSDPAGIVVNPLGGFFISDVGNRQIKKIAADGTVTTIAGSGNDGTADGKGAAASFGKPSWLAVDGTGILYVLDFEYNTVRKITPDGTVTTFINNLNYLMTSITVDANNNLYVAMGFEILKYAPDGTSTVFAGSMMHGNQDGLGAAASFDFVAGLCFDRNGNLWVCDYGNGQIRMISPGGLVSTVPFQHQFFPYGCVVFDGQNNFFLSNIINNTIEELPAGQSAGITFAGYYSSVGFQNGTGQAASFSGVGQLAIDAAGNFYVTDQNNNAIRKITPGALVTTFAGGTEGNQNGNINNRMSTVSQTIPVIVASSLTITSGLENKILPVNSACPVTLPDYTPGVTVADVCSSNIHYVQNPAAGTPVGGSDPVKVTITATDDHYGETTGTFMVTPAAAPVAPPVITISVPSNTVCAGTPVIFKAEVQHGGTNPVYRWLLNGNLAGTNSPSFECNPSNGDVISCILTPASSCSTPATSNAITMSINPVLKPSVTISANGNNSCAGFKEILTATAVNCGPRPVYAWLLNGVPTLETGAVYTSTQLANNDQVTCIVTASSSVCVTDATATAGITILVSPPVTPTISISGPGVPVCPNAETVFTATATNASNNAIYQWTVNGLPAGSGGTVFKSNSLADGDILACTLTTSGTCLTTPTVVSNTITLHVRPARPASLQINPSNVDVCSGTPILFTAIVTNAGNHVSYQWTINQQPAGDNSAVFTPLGIENGDVVNCTIANAGDCVPPLSAIPVAVKIEPLPSVTFTGNPVIKKGGNVTLSPLIIGNISSWQWSPSAGLSDALIANPVAAPAVTTTYTLTVATSTGCQVSGNVTVNVQNSVSPPNAFSPNGDGINDNWEINSLSAYPGCRVDIFNRYGALLFHSIGYSKPWDGTFLHNSVAAGTYYYIINLDDKSKVSGNVTVIR